MNPPWFEIHWPGRGRYYLGKMCRRSYRPRPDNGSGDSPRPPFLTEFVNHIGKLTLVAVVYHLFGGQLGLRVPPHVERPFRLKTKASRRIPQLQAANAHIGQNAVVGRSSLVVRKICKRGVPQLHRRPIMLLIRTTNDQFLPRAFQRRWVFIEPNQMTRCAEAFCDFVTVPAKAHRGVE